MCNLRNNCARRESCLSGPESEVAGITELSRKVLLACEVLLIEDASKAGDLHGFKDARYCAVS